MNLTTDRRTALQAFGMAIAAGSAGLLSPGADAAAEAPRGLIAGGATALAELTKRLAEVPRRRVFETVPMILNNRDQWDHEALSEVLAYRSPDKQVWDNTDIGGPWLNVMRNSLNAQIWSFGHSVSGRVRDA
jgi:hypothetical protein